ncbi:MAG: corrinoid protein [Lentisphaeria bacterium]|nr:corrinoid protein [Lentisphaeria bacterium]
MLETLSQISDLLIKGRAPQVKELVEQALSEGIEPGEILNQGLVSGMSIIGERFKNNEVYVPEVLIAARAMNAGMGVLKPKLVEAGVKPKGCVAVGTVKGDLHDIGKNLVCMMLEGAGYNVLDLGVNVESAKFVAAAKENGAQLIAMSALLTTTMGAMKETVDAVKSENLQDQVKIMIGGAPVTQSFSDEIGADGYAADAASAVDLANQLLGL